LNADRELFADRFRLRITIDPGGKIMRSIQKQATAIALSFNTLALQTLVWSTLALTTTNTLLLPETASAQFQRQPGNRPEARLVIPAGTPISVEHDKAEKIIVAPNETMPLTLKVSRDVMTPLGGRTLIPKGSRIIGELRPIDGGAQFVARELVRSVGPSLELDATSDVVTTTEEIRRGSDKNSILEGALIGAAAASILSEIFGDIDLLEVIVGGGVGAATGAILGRKETTVVVIEPDRDLTLTVNSDLVIH
jgi:hypothetical protein